MILIDLSGNFINLDGSELHNNPMAKTLAHQFANAVTNEPAKYMTWATNLWQSNQITVSNSEHDEIVQFVKLNAQLTNLAKQQIVRAIEGK